MEKNLEIQSISGKSQEQTEKKKYEIPQMIELTGFDIEGNCISFSGGEEEMNVVFSLFSQVAYFCKVEEIKMTFSFTKALMEDGVRIDVYFEDDKQTEMLGDLIIWNNQTLTLDSIKEVNNRGLKLVKENNNI